MSGTSICCEQLLKPDLRDAHSEKCDRMKELIFLIERVITLYTDMVTMDSQYF